MGAETMGAGRVLRRAPVAGRVGCITAEGLAATGVLAATV